MKGSAFMKSQKWLRLSSALLVTIAFLGFVYLRFVFTNSVGPYFLKFLYYVIGIGIPIIILSWMKKRPLVPVLALGIAYFGYFIYILFLIIRPDLTIHTQYEVAFLFFYIGFEQADLSRINTLASGNVFFYIGYILATGTILTSLIYMPFSIKPMNKPRQSVTLSLILGFLLVPILACLSILYSFYNSNPGYISSERNLLVNRLNIVVFVGALLFVILFWIFRSKALPDDSGHSLRVRMEIVFPLGFYASLLVPAYVLFYGINTFYWFGVIFLFFVLLLTAGFGWFIYKKSSKWKKETIMAFCVNYLVLMIPLCYAVLLLSLLSGGSSV
ncbi:MAG TPA: hypothetical protein PLH02_04580 [Bacillota bacterium]|nr:hypothetical protein [Bacillota bacterium]HPQ62125.1 hypothetical protein [Bacillota bacterium]